MIGVGAAREQMTQDGPAPASPLRGARICLVFEPGLAHYTRLLDEIAALQESGATVEWLTSHPGAEDPPLGVRRTVAPLDSSIAESAARWRPLRIAGNLAKDARASLAERARPGWTARARVAALERLAPRVDLFWVVDFPGLPTTMAAAERNGVRVLYETVDLVPEYRHLGERHRARALAEEAELVPRVDGFVTACDSYADYYMERYGHVLRLRPVVRDNMPRQIVAQPAPTRRPLRLLFLGGLLPDRPVEELVRAMAMTSEGSTLTFQGANHLGEAPAALIRGLGLDERVRLVAPCAPGATVEAAAAYDVGLVALRGRDENERRASTSKLFTCMAAGLAILGSRLPGIARVVEGAANGRLVSGMEPATWASAVDALATLPDAQIDLWKARSLDEARRHAWGLQKPAFLVEFARALGPRRAS